MLTKLNIKKRLTDFIQQLLQGDTTMKEHRTWREYLVEQLAANRAEAIDYIRFALEEYHTDGDTDVFLLSLQTFVDAQVGITELAKRTHMSPDALQKVLSSDKTLHIDTLGIILNAIGCQLSVVPSDKEELNLESTPEDQKISAAG